MPKDIPSSTENSSIESRDERLSEISKEAYRLLKDGLTATAIEKFETILSEDPRNRYALVGMGDCLRRERRHKEAVSFYEKCLTDDPENNYAMFGLADCFKVLGQFERAVEVWDRYLATGEDNFTVLTRAGDAFRKVGNYGKSKELYERVLARDSQNPYALIGLGHLSYDFKKYENALEYWKTVESNAGRKVDIRILTSIGNCHRKLKNFTEGTDYYHRALEKHSRNFYALFGLADCHRGLNEPDKSLIYWNKILEKDPRNRLILTRAGDAYRNLGDLENAEGFYRRALAVEFDIYAEIGLALIVRAKNSPAEALSMFEDLMEKEPSNHRLVLEAADCCKMMGRTSDGLALLTKWTTRNPPSKSVDGAIKRFQN